MNRFAGLRHFFLIWFGQLTSGIGSRLSSFALGIWVLKTTGSTTQFALIFVSMAVPALLIAPFAGALVDRWDRRRVMIVCDLVSATIQIGMATLLMNGQLQIWHLYVGVGITAVATAFHAPAYAASIPLLTTREQLTRVNGMVQTGNAIAMVAGPLLAGVLVSTISLHGVLIVDALTFLAAVCALTLARVPRPAPNDAPESLLKEAATGWRYVRERGGLLGLLMVFGASNFMFAIASIAITPLVLSMTDPAGLGIQMAVGGAGLLLGGLAMTATGGLKRRVHGVLGFTLLAGLALAVHGLAPSFVLVTAAGFVFFLTLPAISASNDSVWQSKVPPGLQGRCFAIQRVLAEAAMPVGYILAGPLAEHVFEPMLMPGGALAASVGAVIGVGAGRGLGLMFIVLGLAMSVVALAGFGARPVREVDQLPDAWDSGAEAEPAAPAELKQA